MPPETAEETTQKPQKTPKKPPKPSAEKPTKQNPPAFPAPPRPKTKDGNLDIEIFLPYWKNLPPEVEERHIVYVNREWPVLNQMNLLTPEQQEEVRLKMRRRPPKYVAKFAAFWESDDWRMEILRRWGSGDYKFYLNDSGAKGFKGDPDLGSHNVCRCSVSIRDDDFPPVIEDLRALDMDDPKNKSYIQFLRMKGVAIPGLKPDEGEDVANNEVVKMLADKVESLSTKVAQGETDKLVDRIVDKVKPNVSAVDPLASTMSMVEKMMSIKADNPVVDIMRDELKAMREEMAAERAENRKLQEEVRKATTPAQPVGDPLEQAFAMFDRFDKFRDKVAPEAKQEQPQHQQNSRSRSEPFWFEKACEIGNNIITQFGPVIAHAMSRTSAQSPQPPQQPNPMQRPAPQPPPQIQANPDVVAFMDFLSTQTIQMLTFCFDNEATGGDFAEWLYQASNIGDDGHPLWIHPQSAMKVPWLKTMHDIGIEKLLDIYKQSQFWGAVALKENGEATFKKFLEELIAWAPPKDDEPEPENFFPTSEVIE